jgi:hypothetical protein
MRVLVLSVLLSSVVGRAGQQACPAHGGPAWNEISSENFALASNLPIGVGRRTLTDLENLRGAMAEATLPRGKVSDGVKRGKVSGTFRGWCQTLIHRLTNSLTGRHPRLGLLVFFPSKRSTQVWSTGRVALPVVFETHCPACFARRRCSWCMLPSSVSEAPTVAPPSSAAHPGMGAPSMRFQPGFRRHHPAGFPYVMFSFGVPIEAGRTTKDTECETSLLEFTHALAILPF